MYKLFQKNFLKFSKKGYSLSNCSLFPYLYSYLEKNSAYNRASYNLGGLHSRSLLLPFASARYFLGAGSGQEKASPEVPYGYYYVAEAKNLNGNIVSLYESEYALPFGYTCDKYIFEDEYEAMDIEQRQQAMLQGCVIKEEDKEFVDNLQHVEAVFTDVNLPYEVICEPGVEFKDNKFIVKEKDAKVTVRFLCPKENELYVKISGLQYEGKATAPIIKAVCGKQKEEIEHYTEKHKYAQGRTDYLINLYTSDKERTSLDITFTSAGTYAIDEFSIIAQPMDILDATINTMTENVMENCDFSANRITGTISLEESKVLCFSLPYSEGWRVFVDGKEEHLLNANIMYSGVLVSEGDHTIELVYTTPYVKSGIVISLIAAITFVALEMALRKKRNC